MLHMDIPEDIHVDIHILMGISTCRYLNVAHGPAVDIPVDIHIHIWISIYPKSHIHNHPFRYLYKSMDIHTRVTIPDVLLRLAEAQLAEMIYSLLYGTAIQHVILLLYDTAI